MVNVLIVTQGRLADELLAAVHRIAGPREHMHALSLDWNADAEQSKERIDRAVAELDSDAGLMILTDVFGGTPYNLATNHFRPGRIEILAGVNLPIVMRIACNENADRPVTELGEWLEKRGRESICLGGLPEKPKDLCRPTDKVGAGVGDGRG